MGNSDKDSKSFGAELKRARIEKGLSLDNISQKTKINKKYLEAIENDQFDFLHEPYVLVFIKAYTKALGLDEEEFKERYYQQVSPQPGAAQEEARHTQSVQEAHIEQSNITPSEYLNKIGKLFKHYRKPIVLIFTIALCFILISFLQKLFSEPEANKLPPVTPMQIEMPPAIIDTVQQKLLELRLSTRDTLWIRVIIDESDTSEILFSPGESRSWEAENKFEIRAGKSTGFDLFFNEEPVQDLIFNGKPLRDVFIENVIIGKLVLTKDGVVELRTPPR